MLQTAKGYVLTGNLKYWVSFKFSAKYKKWYVLVSIDMYCICIGMYLYVLVLGFSVQHEGACAKAFNGWLTVTAL